MGEKHIQEKYLGTIFTKQQSGFNPDAETLKSKLNEEKTLKIQRIEKEDNPNISL